MSVVGGQPKKKTRKCQLKSNNTHQTRFSNLLLLLVRLFVNLLTLIHLSFSSLWVDPWDTPGELFFL